MSLYQRIKDVFSKSKKKPVKIKVNAYRLKIQPDVSAYELHRLTFQRGFASYMELDDWYDKLPDLCKRHVIKFEEEVDYNKVYV